MAEWTRICDATIKEHMRLAADRIAHTNRILDLLDTRTPEQKEAARQKYEKELARLLAIEAAKTPAQRRREQQEHCHHDFIHTRCRKCHKHVTAGFLKGYSDGFDKGYDAGSDTRGIEE